MRTHKSEEFQKSRESLFALSNGVTNHILLQIDSNFEIQDISYLHIHLDVFKVLGLWDIGKLTQIEIKVIQCYYFLPAIPIA